MAFAESVKRPSFYGPKTVLQYAAFLRTSQCESIKYLVQEYVIYITPVDTSTFMEEGTGQVGPVVTQEGGLESEENKKRTGSANTE